MAGERSDASHRDNVAKEGHLSLSKKALGQVHHQNKGPQSLEDQAEVANMGGKIRAGDEDVVQVDEDEWQVYDQPVHHALEGVASVPEAKGHGKPLKQTKGGDDGGFGNVPLGHGDLVVPQLKKSWMLGTGYWSGMVMLFRAL